MSDKRGIWYAMQTINEAFACPIALGQPREYYSAAVSTIEGRKRQEVWGCAEICDVL